MKYKLALTDKTVESTPRFLALKLAFLFHYLVARQAYCIFIKIMRQPRLNRMNREEARRLKKACHDFPLWIGM